jgi:hypothetical protein
MERRETGMTDSFAPRDPDAILTIALETKAPMDLEDFALGLTAWQSDYGRFYAKAFPDHAQGEARLLVKQVRSGSILIDLLPVLAPIISDLEQIKTIVEYVEAVRKKVSPWLKKDGRNPDASISELTDFHRVLAGIAKDNRGSLELKARYVRKNGDDEEVRSELVISSDQARTIQANIEAERIERKAPEQKFFEQVVMYLHQASLDEARAGKSAGEKGVIESISERPLKLVYASDLAGQRIKSVLREDDNPLKKAFVIDVNVETVRGVPQAYRVTHVHSVETLP